MNSTEQNPGIITTQKWWLAPPQFPLLQPAGYFATQKATGRIRTLRDILEEADLVDLVAHGGDHTPDVLRPDLGGYGVESALLRRRRRGRRRWAVSGRVFTLAPQHIPLTTIL